MEMLKKKKRRVGLYGQIGKFFMGNGSKLEEIFHGSRRVRGSEVALKSMGSF